MPPTRQNLSIPSRYRPDAIFFCLSLKSTFHHTHRCDGITMPKPPPRQTGTLTMSQQTRTPSPTSASQVHNELQDHLTLLPEHACPSGLHYKRHVLSSLILWKELSVGPCPYIFPVPYSQNLEPSILYTHQFSLFPFFTIANTHHRPPQTLPLRAQGFKVRR